MGWPYDIKLHAMAEIVVVRLKRAVHEVAPDQFSASDEHK